MPIFTETPSTSYELTPSIILSILRVPESAWVASTDVIILSEYLISSWTGIDIVSYSLNQNVTVDSAWTSAATIASGSEFLSSPWTWTTVVLVTTSSPALSNPFRSGGTALPPGVPSEITLKT